jgi:hypothetical protein
LADEQMQADDQMDSRRNECSSPDDAGARLTA